LIIFARFQLCDFFNAPSAVNEIAWSADRFTGGGVAKTRREAEPVVWLAGTAAARKV